MLFLTDFNKNCLSIDAEPSIAVRLQSNLFLISIIISPSPHPTSKIALPCSEE